MQILIVSTFFPPLNSIASLRPYSWAKYWSLEGHDVAVLTTKKDPDLYEALEMPFRGFEVLEVDQLSFFNKLKKSYMKETGYKEINHKVRNCFREGAHKSSLRKYFLNRLWYSIDALRKKRGIFSACRMPDLSDFWKKPALRAIKKKDKVWDLVVSTAGPYVVHMIAWKLKQDNLAKCWIADYRDMWVDSHFPGLFPFTVLEKILEKKLVGMADIITTVSLPLAEILALKFGRQKVHVIEHGFDSDDLKELSPEPILPLNGKLRIVYTGRIYQKRQDPSPLFKAIRDLSRDKLNRSSLDNLEIFFAGPSMPDLKKLIRKYKVEKWVRYLGFLKREDSLRLQRDAHFLLFLDWNFSQRGVLSGKIYEYIFSGTPIVSVGADNSASKFIRELHVGVVLGNDVKKIKTFLIAKLSNIKKEILKDSFDFLRLYERKHLALKLLSLVQ